MHADWSVDPMERPDLTRPQFVERFHFTDGRGNDAGLCGLYWESLPDGRLLVIAYEHPDNPAQSITNAAASTYQQFVDEAEIDPRRIVWVEHYPSGDAANRPVFDPCVFQEQTDGTWEPDWTPMRAGHWRELGVQPPATPTFTRVKPHPEAVGDDSSAPDNIGDYYPPSKPPAA